VINLRKIGVHVRKPVDHLVTTSARRTCRTQATNTTETCLFIITLFLLFVFIYYIYLLYLFIVFIYFISYVGLFVLWCFNATFNKFSVFSWWSVLLVEETGGQGENQFNFLCTSFQSSKVFES
jgi:hypothetical protein